MSRTGKSILKGLKEALEHDRGQKTGARAHQFTAADVARIRKATGLSQEEFSQEFEISVSTLRKWEQGSRVPRGPAHVLLRVIERAPKTVLKALQVKADMRGA
ncbi:MAG: helix-turn-helix domain-containing protein [Alphaproteobacteria bacterium]|nr:MAG: helix-turn-helix domain-containing protein [Alphaproteobacteria bacterium]